VIEPPLFGGCLDGVHFDASYQLGSARVQNDVMHRDAGLGLQCQRRTGELTAAPAVCQRFDAVSQAEDMDVIRTAPRAPRMNPHYERIIGTLRNHLCDQC
jgi:hypothetical protein